MSPKFTKAEYECGYCHYRFVIEHICSEEGEIHTRNIGCPSCRIAGERVRLVSIEKQKIPKRLKVKQSPAERVIEIEGVRYSYYFFLGLGHRFKLNTPFVITERGKTVTIQDLQSFKNPMKGIK